MRRMDKVFEERGIVYEADEQMIMWGPEYDTCQKLVDITDDFIIAVWYSAVLDPQFVLYDRRSLQMIAQQNVSPEYEFFGDKSKNPWYVAVMQYEDDELVGYYRQAK